MRTLQLAGHGGYGGATKIMLDWSRHLLAKGCTVDLLCTDPRMVSEAETIDGGTIIRDIIIPKEIRPLADVRAVAQVMALCRRRSYDVVHTYTASPSFVGRLAARLAGTPVIVNHQGGWAVNPTSSVLERLAFTPLEYIANAFGTRTICVTPAENTMARRLRLAPPGRLVTIVNGVDVSHITARGPETEAQRNEARRALGFGPDSFVVGSTSRLVPGKDTSSMIRALAKVMESGNVDVRLVLAGDGDDDEVAALKSLATDLGVADRVDFRGFVNDIPSFLLAIDCWVSATLTEGLSIALLEAMAARCPVITTSIPQNADVVTDQATGLLVDVQSPEELAESIHSLVADPALGRTLGAAARNHVLHSYSQQRMFDETWDLYQDLLGRRRKSEEDR